jgi:hypothetical protein
MPETLRLSVEKNNLQLTLLLAAHPKPGLVELALRVYGITKEAG